MSNIVKSVVLFEGIKNPTINKALRNTRRLEKEDPERGLEYYENGPPVPW